MTSAQRAFRPEPSNQYQIREVTFYHNGAPYSIPIPFELTEDITSEWGMDVGSAPPLDTHVFTLDPNTNGTTLHEASAPPSTPAVRYSPSVSNSVDTNKKVEQPPFPLTDFAISDTEDVDALTEQADTDSETWSEDTSDGWGSLTFDDEAGDSDDTDTDEMSFVMSSESDFTMQSDSDVMVTRFHDDDNEVEQDQLLSAPHLAVTEYVPDVLEPEAPPLPPLLLNPEAMRSNLANEQKLLDVSDLEDLDLQGFDDTDIIGNFIPGESVTPQADSATLRRHRDLPAAFIQRPPIKTQQEFAHGKGHSDSFVSSNENPDPYADDAERVEAPPEKLNLKLLIIPLVLGTGVLALFGYILFGGSSSSAKTVSSTATTVVKKAPKRTTTGQQSPSSIAVTTSAQSAMKNFCTAARQYPPITLTPSTPPTQLQQEMTAAQTATAAMVATSPPSTKAMATTINASINTLTSILSSVQWHYTQITSAQITQVEQVSTQLNTAVSSLNTILAKC